MSETPPRPVFLERASYRRRRMMDAARLLPVLGAVLFMLPLIWPAADSPAVAAGEARPVAMSEAILYVFGVWAALILATAGLGIAARGWNRAAGPDSPDGGR